MTKTKKVRATCVICKKSRALSDDELDWHKKLGIDLQALQPKIQYKCDHCYKKEIHHA